MLNTKTGTVRSILSWSNSIKLLKVEINSVLYDSILYTELVGNASEGDKVLLNTTAIDLNLGTGGYHFVIANLSSPMESCDASRETGHIMKLRYTPLQFAVNSWDEQLQDDIVDSIEKTPVIICGLHSQLIPVALSVKHLSQELKTAYIVQEGGSLPIGFSKITAYLKKHGLIDLVITPGNTFGGDIEVINTYTGLLAAYTKGADIVISAPGPGTVGSGTKFGFTSIEVGEIVNKTSILDGIPIVVPRISFSDGRSRHQGLSHHTITALTRIALKPCHVTIPKLNSNELYRVIKQVEEHNLGALHNIHFLNVVETVEHLKDSWDHLLKAYSSMGRSYEDELWGFASGIAAGTYGNFLLECL